MRMGDLKSISTENYMCSPALSLIAFSMGISQDQRAMEEEECEAVNTSTRKIRFDSTKLYASVRNSIALVKTAPTKPIEPGR